MTKYHRGRNAGRPGRDHQWIFEAYDVTENIGYIICVDQLDAFMQPISNHTFSNTVHCMRTIHCAYARCLKSVNSKEQIPFAFRGQQFLLRNTMLFPFAVLITSLCISTVDNNTVYTILIRHRKHHLYINIYYPRACLTFSQSQGSLTVSPALLSTILWNECRSWPTIPPFIPKR